jgi:uncharacterized protein
MTDLIPVVSRLFIYPIKSLDRVEIDRIGILRSGALQGDRQLAIIDRSGQFVNGKRNQKVHALRSEFDLATNVISLRIEGTDQTYVFDIDRERDLLTNWLGEYLGLPIEIQQNCTTGFPDDLVSPGPTIISTATLTAIASWYPGLDVEQVRLRLRTNIEISGVPAFWEDRLFAAAEETVPFQIGAVQFMGVNPCQRCIVVTRDPKTGAAYPNFQKTFVAQRQATLPTVVDRSRFNHFYRLAINTRLPVTEAGKTIYLGDKITIN